MGLIVFASDVEAEQARTLADARALDLAVQKSSGVDPTTNAQWVSFLRSLSAFCRLPVYNVPRPWLDGSTYLLATANTGQTMTSYEAGLASWHTKLGPMLQAPPPPFVNPWKDGPSLEQATTLAEVGLAGLVIGGALYLVHKVT